MRFWKLLLPLLASTLCFAAQADRIAGTIDSSQRVTVPGNVHGLAKAQFDQGRADSNRILYGVSLVFKPSATQQKALNALLAQQQDPGSQSYHKWLTPAQFADRFGMSQNDINKVAAWLQSQGLTVNRTANSRNQIFFEGTVAQVEAAFRTEIHNYLVDGELHYANATEPLVPAALSGIALAVQNLHNFQPKPRAVFRKTSSEGANPHFTSDVSGNHYLAPGDFATIYQIQSLYSAGIDGTGQKIALTGQSAINLGDVANFRNAAGLAAKAPTLLLEPGTGTSTRCPGDEGESDLDVEWSGAVAKNASITLVYAGVTGNSCNGRSFGAFDALQYAIDQNIAPVISNSYGNCEANIGLAFAQTMQGWVQQANSQGQTVISSSGDSGAADCDFQATTATLGFAVDIPAAIPEVTGMGGTEFNGDAEGGAGVNGVVPATQYWAGTNGSDTISSALSYIPEMGWNDSAADKALAASGGGASTLFAKPTWQTGTGVPADGQRDVPDLALNASANHDPYLFCSEDGPNGTIVATCTAGFRDSGGFLTVVGGTSAAAPTFAAVAALVNQYLVTNGFQANPGLGNANPNLYYIATNNPSAMNDVTVGNNIVPCTLGTPNCPSTSPFQFGFSAGVGYDQVTGLGSVNADKLAVAWGDLFTTTTTSVSPPTTTVNFGASVTLTATVTPNTTTGSVSFYNNGSTTAIGSATLSSGKATFTTTSFPVGTNSIVGAYGGINAASTSSAVTVTVTPPDFTLTVANPLNPSSVPAGQSSQATLTISPVNGSTQTVNFNSTTSPPGGCTANLPAGALCSFTPPSVTLDGTHSANVTLTITTAANMALSSGALPISVTGTASGTGGTSHATTVNLTVTATNQSYTLSSTNGTTFPVSVGGTASVNVTVANASSGGGSPIPFVGATTALPLIYTCTGSSSTVSSLAAAEITCTLPNNGQPTNAAAVTVTLKTTPVTTGLRRPLDRGNRIFYALLLPGLFGIVFVSGSRTRGLRLLGLIVVLGLSTLGLGSCGGGGNSSSSLSNPGTPPGTYTVTIAATTGGTVPLTNSNAFTITLNVQ